MSYFQTLCLQRLLLHAENAIHIYVETAVYLVKRHHSVSLWMNSDTRIRHKYRQIFLLLASGAVPELPNGQWEAARDSGDVMCATIDACHARTASPTQFIVQHTTCLLSETRVYLPRGSIPNFGTNLVSTALHWTKTRGQTLRAKWNRGERCAACSHHAKRCEWRAMRVVGQNNGPVQSLRCL